MFFFIATARYSVLFESFCFFLHPSSVVSSCLNVDPFLTDTPLLVRSSSDSALAPPQEKTPSPPPDEESYKPPPEPVSISLGLSHNANIDQHSKYIYIFFIPVILPVL